MRNPVKFFIYHALFFTALIIQDTHVSKSFFGEESPYIYYIALCLLFTSITCFSGVITNPGIVEENCETTPFFCTSCQCRIPVRAFHCETCRKCIRRRLHHSEWADQCVGLETQLYYFMFLASEFFFLLFSIIEIIVSLCSFHQIQSENRIFGWISNYFLLLIFFPFLVFYLIQVFILFIQHAFILLTNGNVLGVKKRFGIMILILQKKERNPFDLHLLDLNANQVFFHVNNRVWEVPNTPEMKDYISDIHQCGIDYISE
ncbi:hypothetical protein TRFO_38380 [Tritrichomonas foetus]|uniref:Palmitoyltransferase n=1 Tax=Tritrichomonas foetus TaxID=1144522 RepID=A0A1J4JDJ4_9EUKA|nr:hypothetical protein TRFO_38380 [Tritrichomonas foetus]|eukprot:OHS95509.1 hypothetical protein TRFO_38380 [Tritrichomonas foetus]